MKPETSAPLSWRHRIFGPPKDFRDPKIFHQISLVAFLAWVGLGADGLSSSAYGPDESFRALIEGRHDFGFLAIFLALSTALTVLVISMAYSHVIEHFPTGGGGYLVATKLLGNQAGVISGAALLVDYILTITVSVASGGDAIFNLLPLELHGFPVHQIKLPLELGVLVLLVLLNLRGVKESVTALLPVFLVFVATHLILIVGGIISHIGRASEVVGEISTGLRHPAVSSWGLFLVFLGAYTRGGGTYTGIEAVSNGLQIMREPRVMTGKRTMIYMASSLAITAGGILICYLLFGVRPREGKTLNGVLVEAFAGSWHPFGLPLGTLIVFLTLASEGALLLVAAQTGFIDGPRVMANMAIDSWLPHRFASLSDRLTSKDGILLMGAGAIALLLGTRGKVDTLVVMYSVNVFLTFSLTMLGMCRLWVQARKEKPDWYRHIAVHLIGFLVCIAILAGMVVEKFFQGAWLTMVLTAALIVLCSGIRAHYRSIQRKLNALDAEFADLPGDDHHGGELDPKQPTAVLLVGSYGGIGIHSLLSIQRMLPGYFHNIVFLSVAVVDSGVFKGVGEVEAQKHAVDAELQRYVGLARRLGWNAGARSASGIDVADEITKICIELAQQFPRIMYFSGKLLWKREAWYQRILHNETAYQVQRRLQWRGLAMTVLPLRVPAPE